MIHQGLGPHAMVGYLEDLGAEGMPQYDHHEDESQNLETFFILDKESEVSS